MNKQRRTSPSAKERIDVRRKTNGHCHICGGHLGSDWTADHVVAYRLGGKGSVGNFLPACGVCNRLRWFYNSKEIKKILQLGIYAHGEIRRGTVLGKDLRKLYQKRGEENAKRRKQRNKPASGK